MVVSGGQRIVKYLLFFFNFVFVVTGLALIIVGGVVEYKARNYLNFLGDSYVSTAILLIILGVVVFFIAFLGCCGATKENICMIQTFSILLFILFIMELAGGIAAYVYKDKLHDIAQEGLNNTFHDALSGDMKAMKGWEDIQHEFKCCGFEGYGDYEDRGDIGINSTDALKRTCCRNLEEGKECEKDDAFKTGCKDGVVNFFKDNIAKVGAAGISIAFIEVIGIVFACCLLRAIKAQYETV